MSLVKRILLSIPLALILTLAIVSAFPKLSEDILKNNDGYTVKVKYPGFKLFLPSSFKDPTATTHGVIYFTFDDIDWIQAHPTVSISYYDESEAREEAFYIDQDEMRERLEQEIDGNPNAQIIQMDECLGIMSYSKVRSEHHVSIDVTNRKAILNLTVESDSYAEALELAQGIIDHAVAKEIPLEELEQAE